MSSTTAYLENPVTRKRVPILVLKGGLVDGKEYRVVFELKKPAKRRRKP